MLLNGSLGCSQRECAGVTHLNGPQSRGQRMCKLLLVAQHELSLHLQHTAGKHARTIEWWVIVWPIEQQGSVLGQLSGGRLSGLLSSREAC